MFTGCISFWSLKKRSHSHILYFDELRNVFTWNYVLTKTKKEKLISVKQCIFAYFCLIQDAHLFLRLIDFSKMRPIIIWDQTNKLFICHNVSNFVPNTIHSGVCSQINFKLNRSNDSIAWKSSERKFIE